MLDLSKRADLVPLSNVVADALAVAEDADCMIVGATARDIRLYYAHGIQWTRRTADVDIACAVRGWQEFATLRQRMLSSGKFTGTAARQRVRHVRTDLPVDLIPYDGVELQPGHRLVWPPHGDDQSRVIGYREARAGADIVRLPGDIDVLVVTLPGLLLLKFFAFEDRALLEPGKDAEDIHFILRNYTDAGNVDRLMYGEHQTLLDADDFDYVVAGAYMAGADLCLLLESVEPIRTIIGELERLLAAELDVQGEARLLGQVQVRYIEEFRNLLVSFQRGLNT